MKQLNEFSRIDKVQEYVRQTKKQNYRAQLGTQPCHGKQLYKLDIRKLPGNALKALQSNRMRVYQFHLQQQHIYNSHQSPKHVVQKNNKVRSLTIAERLARRAASRPSFENASDR